MVVLNIPLYRIDSIRVKKKDKIASGGFSDVYRMSKYRVVKVYKSQGIEVLREIADEIAGVKIYFNALKVFGVVDVFVGRSRVKRFGVIKMYIPNMLNEYDKIPNVRLDRRKGGNDFKRENYGRDNKGKIWRLDTQLLKIPSMR